MVQAGHLVLGAKSLVGEEVLRELNARHDHAVALTRGVRPADMPMVSWHSPAMLSTFAGSDIRHAICVAHVWVVADYIPAMRAAGVERLVALSTTSLFTKRLSGNAEEQEAWRLFERSEQEVMELCEAHGIGCTILRPTLIYGNGRDRNVMEIANLIRRVGFFPLFGRAEGKRRPIHANDVAKAAILAVETPAAIGKTYTISGGETLAYRDMVARIFTAMGRRAVMPSVPLGLFRLVLRGFRLLPRFRHWTPDMAMRMNADQDFDHDEARQDFGFAPIGFQLTAIDVGKE